MVNPPPYPGTGGDTGAESDRRSTTRASRWVFVVGIAIMIALVLLIVVLHLSGIIGGPRAH